MAPGELEALFARAIDPSLIDAARDYLAARRERDNAQARLLAAQDRLGDYEAVFTRKLDEAGMKSVTVDDGGKSVLLTAATSDYYSLPVGALDDLRVVAWLLRAGGHDILVRHVDRNDLTKLCRRLAERGGAVHPAVRVVKRRVVRVNNRGG